MKEGFTLKKKTLAILLCLAMLFTMLPFAASAEAGSSVEAPLVDSRESTGDSVFENEPDIEEDGEKKAAGRSTTKGLTGEFSMTWDEAKAAATVSYDISPNGDGSVMAYRVPNPNGDGKYTLALYGNGPTKDYTSSAPPWYKATVYNAIYVDDGITYLGRALFTYLSKVKTVRLPETLTGWGDYMFRQCSSLVELTVPSGITTLSKEMCNQCTSLERVTLPEGITTIPAHCFYKTTSMKSITLPQSVTKIEKYAFCHSGIESIDLTNITAVGVRCFAGSQLKGVMNVPKTCGLSFDAFSDCQNLEQVNWLGNRYNIPGSYVHEDIVQLFQESVKVADSAGLCAITASGMVYDTLYHEEEGLQFFVNTITQRSADYGMTTTQMAEYFNSVGLRAERTESAQYAISRLAQGDLVVVSWRDLTANVYHGIVIYGITEDGYIYVADPAYETDAWTKYDISTVFDTWFGDIQAFVVVGYDYDTSMKTNEIKSEKKLPDYPASLTSTAPAGAKTGTENGEGDTLLFKSAQWTNYRLGEAEARLDFSYAPEATDYIYILDYSDSQTKSTINSDYTNISMEKTLAYEAIADMLAKNPEARAAVVRFNDSESASYTDFTTDASVIYNAISAEQCEGFTGYAYGLDQALQLMNSRTGEAANRRTVVVFVTDGDPQRLISQSSSGIYGGDEAAALRNAGAELYGIIFTGESFTNAANNLAALTGDASRVFTCKTADAFVEAMNKPVEAQLSRSFTLTDTIGEDFLYGGALSTTKGTSAVIDDAQRTITWTLNNIVPNTEYTLTISLKCKRDSSGQYVHGDLPTNKGNAVVTENGEKVNEVETPILKRSVFLETAGAQAHMIHKYTDISRPDNPGLYTDGIRFGVELDMKELQETLEPGDKVAFAVVMLPLDKLQSGDTTNYLTVNVDDSGKLTSNGSYTFVNHTQAIASAKKLDDSTMIEWTQEMEDCKTPEEFATLLTNAGVSIFEVTDKGVRYSVYMMFTNSKTLQAQVEREIAYRGVIVTSIEGNGYAVTYSYQRNNSATRIFNQFNYVNYGVINVKLATPEDMMHGESEYNPPIAVQSAAIQ